jgi:hemoglobin-like flavoprotein
MSDTRNLTQAPGRGVPAPTPPGPGPGARMASRRGDSGAPPAPGAGLSPQAIELVRKSWAAVMPISDAAASLFYERLFELDPSVRPLFKGDMREQKKKLMQTLAIAVDGLSSLDKLVPVLKALGVRHAGYMVQDRHYDLVGQALLWTLREGLGNAFTPDVESAWTKVYGLVAETMRTAAAHQDAPAPSAPGAHALYDTRTQVQPPRTEPRAAAPVHAPHAPAPPHAPAYSPAFAPVHAPAHAPANASGLVPALAPEAWSTAPRAPDVEHVAPPRASASGALLAASDARPLVVQFGGQGMPTLQVHVAVESASFPQTQPSETSSAGSGAQREGLAAGMLLGTLCLIFSMLGSAFVTIALSKTPSISVLAGVPIAALALSITSFAFGYLWARPKSSPRRSR